MALKLSVPKFDDLTDDEKKLYSKQADGSGVLDVEDDGGSIAGLRKNRDDLLRENKSLKGKVPDFDIERARSALKRIEEIEAKDAKDKNDWGAREQQLVERHKTDLQAAKDLAQKYSDALYKQLVDNVVMTEGAEFGVKPKLLLPAIRENLKVVEDAGEFVVQVLDGKKNPRIGDSAGNPMTIKQYLAELRGSTEFDGAFDGTGSSGGGAKPKLSGGDRGTKTITANDNRAFLDNLGDIAKGKVKVAA